MENNNQEPQKPIKKNNILTKNLFIIALVLIFSNIALSGISKLNKNVNVNKNVNKVYSEKGCKKQNKNVEYHYNHKIDHRNN